jgi:predicted double-glycine peptidase
MMVNPVVGWGKAIPAAFLLFCLWQIPGGSYAATVEINLGTPEMPVYVTREVDSLMDRRHAHVQLQERDYSCGAASMTSIFNYYLEYPIREIDVIQGLLDIAKKKGTLEKIIKRRGFTLLDLKRFAESKGFTTSAFKLEFDDLVGLGEPAIVPIIPNGYKHFVAFRGADKHYVYLADPSFGNLTQPIEDFKRDWYGFTNIALVVHRKPDQDKNFVPPLIPSEHEKFNPDLDIDAFKRMEPPSPPLIPTEF